MHFCCQIDTICPGGDALTPCADSECPTNRPISNTLVHDYVSGNSHGISGPIDSRPSHCLQLSCQSEAGLVQRSQVYLGISQIGLHHTAPDSQNGPLSSHPVLSQDLFSFTATSSSSSQLKSPPHRSQAPLPGERGALAVIHVQVSLGEPRLRVIPVARVDHVLDLALALALAGTLLQALPHDTAPPLDPGQLAVPDHADLPAREVDEGRDGVGEGRAGVRDDVRVVRHEDAELVVRVVLQDVEVLEAEACCVPVCFCGRIGVLR